MRKIKTSIVVPVYNTEQYLKECFESIYAQTQTAIEVIAVNDGSTDNSLCILEEIKKEHPQLIIYTQENKGLGAARNKGIELATGEYIYFIDSDDCLLNTAMETCYHYAKNNKLDILMFDAETFGELAPRVNAYDRSSKIEEQVKTLTGEEFACKYWSKSYTPSACLIYTSLDFIHKYNLEFISDIYYEDNEFHCKTMSLAERVMYIPRILYRRRCREKSISSSGFGEKNAKDYLCMIQAVHQIECKRNMQVVMHKMELKFLQNLTDKCVGNNIHNQGEFAYALFRTALNICGQDINEINTFCDIETLYKTSMFISGNVASDKIKQKILERKREIFERLFTEIPFRDKDKYVGIYGTGQNTERFLDEYQKNFGNISAKVIFIDSIIRTGQNSYRNCNIYNVEDIAEIPFECIVIASSKYETEIVQTITDKWGSKFRLIRLSSDLDF